MTEAAAASDWSGGPGGRGLLQTQTEGGSCLLIQVLALLLVYLQVQTWILGLGPGSALVWMEVDPGLWLWIQT